MSASRDTSPDDGETFDAPVVAEAEALGDSAPDDLQQEELPLSDDNLDGNPADAPPAPLPRWLLVQRIVAFCVTVGVGGAALLMRTDRVVRSDGRTAPRYWSPIRANAAGDVRERLVLVGDAVVAGAPIARLVDDVDRDAVANAVIDLESARREGAAEALLGGAARSTALDGEEAWRAVPPAELLDLAVWIERGLSLRLTEDELKRGANERLQVLQAVVRRRVELQASPSWSKQDEASCQRAGAAVVSLTRGARRGQSLAALDAALEGLEAVIIGGLGSSQPARGYLDLQLGQRAAQLELRKVQVEAQNLLRVREGLGAFAGEKRNERANLRQALEAFLARARPGPFRDGEGEAQRRRATVLELGALFLSRMTAVERQIEGAASPGLASLKQKAAVLRSDFNLVDRALGQLIRSSDLVLQGLVVIREYDEQLAMTEHEVGVFLEGAEAIGVLARGLVDTRLGEVQLDTVRRSNALDLFRGRLREAMATGKAPAAATTGAGGRSPLTSLQRAEQDMVAARRAVESRVVHAPMGGVVTWLGLHEREQVSKNEVVGQVERLDVLVFKGLLTDRELSRAAPKQAARISVGGRTVGGHVLWVAPQGTRIAEKDEPAGWNVFVELDDATGLLPSERGRVEIVVDRPRGLDRLLEWVRPAPAIPRRYPIPEALDPTLVAPGAPVRGEPNEEGKLAPAAEFRQQPITLAPTAARGI